MRTHVLIALALGGCGDDGSGGMPTDAQANDARSDAGSGAREGQVFIAEAASPISVAVAMFVDGPLFPVVGSEGLCQGGGNDPASSLDAGSITISGTANPITLSQQDPDDVYIPPGMLPPDVFVPGATLTMAGTGGAAVPAFSGTVTAPEMLAGYVPPPAYSRSSPPTFHWTAGSGDQVWFLLISATNNVDGAVLCRVPDTGSFPLTTAAFALMPSGVTQVTTVVYRVNETTVQAGAYRVALRAADGRTSPPVSVTP